MTLLNIDENFAVFAVVQGPNKDVLKHTTGPFMYINQFKLCSELIRMPIESFLRLAEEIGDPKGKLVILSNTGRCGSTLLTQLFEELPSTVAISEPEVLMAFTHESKFDSETPKRKQEILQVLRHKSLETFFRGIKVGTNDLGVIFVDHFYLTSFSFDNFFREIKK